MGKIPGLNTSALIITSLVIWGTRKIIERSLESVTKLLVQQVKPHMKEQQTTEDLLNALQKLVWSHGADWGRLASWTLAEF